MKRALFDAYQYISPLLLTPLSFWLWWQYYEGNLFPTFTAWLLPILYAYIVPAVGTNILKVWEFDTRFRLGRFRPHHGFVFGSATAMIAWLVHPGTADSALDIVVIALIFGLVLGVINIVYDIKAIDAGVLHVYNQPWADGANTRVIVMDYAPWFFGGFGVLYGLALGGSEWLMTQPAFSDLFYGCVLLLSLLITLAVPVVGYRWQSFRRHGHSGCMPIMKKASHEG